MHVLLVAFGSAGDVLPMVSIGRELARRGHEVEVVSNEHFANVVRKANLGFVPFGSEEVYLQHAADARGAQSLGAVRAVFQLIGESIRPLFDLVSSRWHEANGDLVVVGTSLALGARLAEEKLGVGFVSVHMSPAIFRSACDNTVLPGLPPTPWMPSWASRLILACGDALVVDPMIAPAVNRARAGLGLPGIARPLHRWWHSARLVLALFPSWFASPQADWPPHTRLLGFVPARAASEQTPVLPPALQVFLDRGDPPIVVTPGSAIRKGRAFFEAARRAATRLGRRAVFVTPFSDQIPEGLGETVLHVPWAPFELLFARSSAVIHHGGIGTSAEALAAGKPQLIVPTSYDQPDNAVRLERLGVARWLSPAAFESARVEGPLGELLSSGAVQAACSALAPRVYADSAAELAATAIIGLRDGT